MTDTADSVRVYRPSLSLSVPPGWLARTSVELIEPSLEARVVVALDELGEQGSLDEYADSYGAMFQDSAPNYQELRREHVLLADRRPAVLRRFRWQPEGGDAIEQLQVYFLQGSRGVAATLSSPRSLDQLESHALELIAGIRLDGAPGGGLVRLADDPRSRTYEALERGELATPRTDDGRDGGEDSSGWQAARTAWNAGASK